MTQTNQNDPKDKYSPDAVSVSIGHEENLTKVEGLTGEHENEPRWGEMVTIETKMGFRPRDFCPLCRIKKSEFKQAVTFKRIVLQRMKALWDKGREAMSKFNSDKFYDGYSAAIEDLGEDGIKFGMVSEEEVKDSSLMKIEGDKLILTLPLIESDRFRDKMENFPDAECWIATEWHQNETGEPWSIGRIDIKAGNQRLVLREVVKVKEV